MRTLDTILFVLVLCGLISMEARADTFQLSDGQTLTGDVVSFNENGLIVRLPEGKYADRVPWSKFSQVDLKRLAQNPKITPLVEPFVEVSQEEKVKKTEVEIKIPDRLERPQTHSVLRAMITSNVGLFVLVVLYAANLFAAYEVSIFRAQPRALVCALAAIPVLGVLAPVIFLSMPTRMARGVEDEVAPEVTAAATQTFAVPGQRAAAAASEPGSALPQARAGASHTTGTVPTSAQVFQRGAYTFNRRFFETRFAGFFAMIRRDAEKDMLMVIKTTRSQVVGQRITRITGNELHLMVPKGVAGEEVAVAFVDIQEISLKHKDA